jgi:addiction module HigA family antidote
MKQKELSEKTNMAETVWSQLLSGKRNITAAIALRLQDALGISAETWLRLQAQYEIDALKIKMQHRQSRQRSNRRAARVS